MEVQTATIDRKQAKLLYREYKKHQHYSTPVDQEIMRAYQLIAQGRMVIKALESITVAGLNAQGLPKLAICRADAIACNFRLDRDGGGRMRDDRVQPRTNRKWEVLESRSVILFPRGSFPTNRGVWEAKALVPAPPLHLRPRRGLANYHILWEAEWTKVVPRDPYLLRRIGKGDLWLVCAHWDLTEVERGALATRIR